VVCDNTCQKDHTKDQLSWLAAKNHIGGQKRQAKGIQQKLFRQGRQKGVGCLVVGKKKGGSRSIQSVDEKGKEERKTTHFLRGQ